MTAPESLKALMPRIRQVELIVESYGYTKGTPEWSAAFDVEWAFWSKFVA
jgi:long-subunit fatty acid transport protein